MIGIYKITNSNNEIYIGQSTNIELRKIYYSKVKCTRQPKIYNSLKKYGWEQHVFEIIEKCTLEQLNEREIYWGLYYNVLGEDGLNLKLGDGRGLVNEETKQKLSKANKGKKRTKEQCLNISKAKKGNKCSDKTKLKMSESRKGFTFSEESKYKMKQSAIGKIRTEEHSKNISKNNVGISRNKGVPKPDGFGEKIRKIKKGIERFENRKHILQYDLEGNFIKEWSSIKEAEQYYNPKPKIQDNIGACCRGKSKTAYKFIWKFK
jgi:hypothetical protein